MAARRGTPSQNFRVPPELWEAVKAKAEQDGITATSIVLDALYNYVGWTE